MAIDKVTINRLLNAAIPEPNTGCWLWAGPVNHAGYGVVYVTGEWRKGRSLAHRVSYAIFTGPIPSGLELDHLCKIPCCVNPGHLEAVTHAVNMERSDAGKPMRSKTHCIKGHAFDEYNTRVSINFNGKPRRICRQCHRLSCQKYESGLREKRMCLTLGSRVQIQ